MPVVGPGIAAGPDGAIWFTTLMANEIARLAPDATLATFPIPTTGGAPYHIVTGPDGALWFTEMAGNKIGRAQLSG